jgi:hypothetical protein|tara:strand:- start:2098 stop:2277 length:180 start_codon:yes stop_codon:yes gene_type:complete
MRYQTKPRFKFTLVFEGVDLKTFDTLKAARAYQPQPEELPRLAMPGESWLRVIKKIRIV